MSDTIWVPELPDRAAGGQPKYMALAQAIRSAIAAQQLLPGQKLPTVRDLGFRLGVTPGTVQRAYGLLTEEGALEAVVGRGTFVTRTDKREEPPYIFRDTPHRALDLSAAGAPEVGQEAAIRAALREMAEAPLTGYLNYSGLTDDLAAIQGILAWLEPFDIGPCWAEDVVLTAGAQHAALIVLQALIRGRRRTVYVEELSYPGFRHAAALAGAEVVAVPMDGEGILPDALAAACARHGPGVFCTTAEVNNPTTIRVPEGRRQSIVEVARSADLHVIDDDTFSVGGLRGPSYRALAPERAWYVTSLSKAVAPGLRFGALVAPKGMSGRALITLRHQTFGLPRAMVDLGARLLSSGAAAEIRDKVRAETNHRLSMARGILGNFAPRSRQDTPFLWLPLPRGWRGSTFARAAEARGVLVRPADVFALVDGRAPNAVRLSVNGEYSRAVLQGGLETLRDLLVSPPDSMEL